MRPIFFFLLFLWSSTVFAVSCDCEVMVYAPMTGSHSLSPNRLKTYELEEFSSYSRKNQLECRQLCAEAFQKDMPTSRLTALLLTYSERLIENKLLGHNCTGLTTLKYPVRVKAVLGQVGIGNVADFIHVVNHEQRCF